jgi:hypothetical protein
MEFAKEKDAIFVCGNPAGMKQKSMVYGIMGIDFVSYWDYAVGNCDPERFIVVDDLEAFVAAFHDKLIGYTLSDGE